MYVRTLVCGFCILSFPRTTPRPACAKAYLCRLPTIPRAATTPKHGRPARITQARKLEAQVAKLEAAVASATTAANSKASKAEAKAAEAKVKVVEAKMKAEIEHAEAKSKVTRK